MYKRTCRELCCAYTHAGDFRQVLRRHYVRIFGRRRALIPPHFADYLSYYSYQSLYSIASRTTASYLQPVLCKKDENPHFRILHVYIVIITIIIINIVAIFVTIRFRFMLVIEVT